MADKDDFCAEMRDKTKNIHDKSDKLINLKLAVVLTDTKLYGQVLADFYFVFQTIENALFEHREHKHVGPLFFQEMQRSSRFEEDLEFYLGSDWRAQVKPSEPAGAYCDRIVHVAENDPSLLIAYAHSMYLALLAGGQIIKKIVKKTLGLTDNRGLAIFEFDEFNRTQIRKNFVANINGMDISRETKDAIIQEKMRVFKMNNEIASNVKPTIKSFQRLSKFIIAILLFIIVFVYFLFKLLL